MSPKDPQKPGGPRPSSPQRRVPGAKGTARPAGASRPTGTQRPTGKDGIGNNRVVASQAPARKPARKPVASNISPATSRRRQLVVFGLVLLIMGVYAAKLFSVQIINGPEVAAEALQSRMSTTVIPAARGDITDANGVVLAGTVERYRLVANQRELEGWTRKDKGVVVASGVADAAKEVAPLLGVDAAELGAILTGDRQYKVVSRDLTPETWRAIRDLGIHGLYGELTVNRVYPSGDIAGNIIGFVGGEEVAGLAGIELVHNEVLAGTAGSYTYERGRGLQPIPGGEQQEEPALPGSTVALTIRRDLQWIAQDAINSQVTDSGAEWGVVVVIDVKTGEILALADSGSVDPNNFQSSDLEMLGSRAVSYAFEPGSTVKAITVAAALEQGNVTPLSQWVAPYNFTTPNNQTFRDSVSHPTWNLTTAGVLEQSSNTGTVQIAETMPPQVLHDYLVKFGFGQRTGVGLPGESAGYLASEASKWDGRTKYTVAFGQGLSSNAIHSTQIFATIANGGVSIQPSVLKSVTAPDGTVTYPEAPKEQVVIQPETAQQVLKMLESPVVNGSARLGQVNGYRVAGKTGTAQVPDEDGQLTKHQANFVGVSPVTDPRIAVGVFVHNPQTSIYGGTIAGPVFSRVMEAALLELAVPPDEDTEPDLYESRW